MAGATQQLLDSGLFEQGLYSFNGSQLTFKLTPASTLYNLRTDNLPLALTGKELEARLHEQVPLFHGKLPVEGGVTMQVKTALEKLLAAQGIKTTLESMAYTDPVKHEVTAISLLMSHPEPQVGLISVAPGSSLDKDAEEAASKLSGSSYSAESSAANIEERIAYIYRDKGYLEVKVKAQRQGAFSIVDDAVKLPFSVSIDKGALYRIDAIQLDPSMLIHQADFDHQSQLHPGDLADASRVRQNWQFLERQYHSQGYMKAVIHAEPTFDRATSHVRYTVTATAGPQYKMGQLTIANVDENLHSRMLALWQKLYGQKMPTGAVFNESALMSYYAIDKSVDPEMNRLFSSVKCNYKLTMNDEERTIDVQLRLEKR